jgi:DUF4097 and DUF4098 domain-containing protein YvlB
MMRAASRGTEVIKVKHRMLILLSGTLLATAAMAEDVNKTVDAALDGHVDIYNTAGTIEVYGWSRSSVEVEGSLGENVEELVLERDGKTVTVKVKVPRNSSHRISSDIVVHLPEKSSIDVSGVSADITVEGVRGVQGLHTVSGDVMTEAFGADIEIASVSGDVDVEGKSKDTDTKATTVSGDVTLAGLSGEVQAEAVSGDVTVDDGEFDRVALETVNGDVIFRATVRKNGRLSGESVNGDVLVELGSKLAGRYDIESFNGDIDNCFGPPPQRTSRYAPGLELRFNEGEGDGSVTISTLNGDIDVCDE